MNSKEKILSHAIALFAEHGYSGLSMRQLATTVNMSVASIYHYFPDKNSLYLAALQYAFSAKEQVFSLVWEAECNEEQRLALLVRSLLTSLKDDPLFHRLIQREILEANAERLQMLAQKVFSKQFYLFMEFAERLAPAYDAYLTAISIIDIICGYIDNLALHQHFPGWKADYENIDIVAVHLTSLLLRGLRP